MTTDSILIINGPGFSGSELQEIEQACQHKCEEMGLVLEIRHSRDQSQIIKWIETDSQGFSGIVIGPVKNEKPSASYFDSLHAAIKSIAHLKLPTIEVHIENIFLPGSKVPAPIQVPESNTGFIAGLGIHGYLLAIQSLAANFNRVQ